MRLLTLSVLFFLLVLSACTQEEEIEPQPVTHVSFISDAYGFSFSYPTDWVVRDSELPERWALSQGLSTILFTVNPSSSESLLALGQRQAVRDILPGDKGLVSGEQLSEIAHTVRLTTFNEEEWYTYAISFAEKDVDSIVSGTVCGDQEVTLVLVTQPDVFDITKLTYSNILESFSC